jgi:hypothetical protein
MTATNRVKDSEFVFQKTQDRKQTWALKWGHAQIFGLETEGDTHPGILEKPLQVLVDGLMGIQ